MIRALWNGFNPHVWWTINCVAVCGPRTWWALWSLCESQDLTSLRQLDLLIKEINKLKVISTCHLYYIRQLYRLPLNIYIHSLEELVSIMLQGSSILVCPCGQRLNKLLIPGKDRWKIFDSRVNLAVFGEPFCRASLPQPPVKFAWERFAVLRRFSANLQRESSARIFSANLQR